MKFLAPTTLLLAAPLLASAASLPKFFDPTQATLRVNTDEKPKVPGDNPLNYCKPPSDYVLQIDNVDLDPNPPAAGKTLTITASGTFNQRIEKGAYVNLEVKYGLISLVKQTVDLCEQLGNVDLECPLEKGPMVLTKDVDLPGFIPKGTFTVFADVYTNADEQVTCLEANNIKF
ncbi:Phosphatidylglycerol/phosphatidylinositol transfer protein [Penicillium angulare]|uniref:Phosphatidylglycerol/phosphatidylinositol transfer protein n=1 Tax=Penicillium angulare TaxID=116970 RepID=A0A9W9K0J0_9EURO|nr:Phosphatidylglycerol/phosphatidylinositol transfer protein [Penicillium angulare]